MRFIFTVAVGVLMTATPCPSGAQLANPTGTVRAPQPTAEMQSLIKAFSGHWSLKLKFEPSKEMPQGLESTGEEAWHAGPEGLTFTEEGFTAGPHAIIVVVTFWRDLTTNDFHAMDCNNQNPHTCDVKGAVDDVVVHWTGGELTVDEKELSHGRMVTSRIVWSDITANSFTETGYLGPPGGPFQKRMTIYATRAVGK
jgi:hypothetical protein